MPGKYQPQIIIKPSYKKKKKKKKLLGGVLLISIILAFFIYLGLNFMIRREIRKIEDIKRENKYLRKRIQKLSSSDIPYEELLRTKYGYIKKGEKLIIYSPYYYKKHVRRIEEVGG